jgi:oxygen-independent coproporphyrinogen-3 oxidase
LTSGLGVYVHWPYCARICPYCDFNVVRERGGTDQKAALTDAILLDLEAQAELTGPRRLDSVFFGGGTPSLMEARAVASVIEAATSLWTPALDLEVTLEANPTDAEADHFAELSSAGVNRLSLGVQSFDDAELRFLGRNHDGAEARRAALHALAHFPRLSLDLIYALPAQTPKSWAAALGAAVGLGPEHISPYQLTIEPGTAFGRAARRGALAPASDDLAADLYEVTQSVLGDLGFEAYEVSNHARGASARSRHNLIYWRGGDYVGVGPGAHGRLTLEGRRLATVAPRAIADYVERVSRFGASAEPEGLDDREAALERLLMGLRTQEGVEMSELAPLNLTSARLDEFSGLTEVRHGRLVATARGRPVLDRVIAELADAR